MRQEKITRASSLTPNETFRHQVKFLALSKAHTKVLPLPCPVLVPRRDHWSSNSSSLVQSLPPLGADLQQNSFLTSLLVPEDRGQTPRQSGRILEPAKKPYTFYFPYSRKAWTQDKPS